VFVNVYVYELIACPAMFRLATNTVVEFFKQYCAIDSV
jgi:hypothetical protein